MIAWPSADPAAYRKRVERLEQRRATPAADWADPLKLAAAAGLVLDPWQADLVVRRPRRALINAARQSGKSSAMAVIAVHLAVTMAAVALCISPTLRQSGELFRKCLTIYRAAGRPVPSDAETQLTLTLANGGRIVSLPGSEISVRGYTADAVLLDESARIPGDLFASVLPMVAATDGIVLAASTPYGRRGWWADLWHDPASGWERVEVPATACPRLTADVLAEAERTMGRWWYSQEFLLAFLDAQTAAFTREEVDRAFVEEVEAWSL